MRTAVTVEGFSEGGDDDPGEAGFELSGCGGAGRVAGEAFDGPLPHPPRHFRECRCGFEHGRPLEDAHWLSLKRE